jgi:hypothetical protein
VVTTLNYVTTSMRRLRRIALYVWLATGILLTASPTTAQVLRGKPDTVRILFIGNSYTYFNDLPEMLRVLAAGGSRAVEVQLGSIVEGGATLERHWNPATTKRIRDGAWDYVVLQEQSLRPIESRGRFVTYGERLVREIEAARARPILYLTWSRMSHPDDQLRLNDAYTGLATRTGALIVPVGPAWQALAKDGVRSELYAEDGSHPSLLGSFVAACTFYRVLFGEFPSEASGAAYGIEARTLRQVRVAVESAVSGFGSR